MASHSFCCGDSPLLSPVLLQLPLRLPPIPSNTAALCVNGPVFSYYYLRVLVSDHRELRSLQPARCFPPRWSLRAMERAGGTVARLRAEEGMDTHEQA